jgi:opacity protein-like surface antigen
MRNRIDRAALVTALATALAALGLAGVAGAEDRKGTLSFGASGQYGFIDGNGSFGAGFDRGPGYGLRFRYSLGSVGALGLSFENQVFKPDERLSEEPEKLTFTNYIANGFLYFGRESRTSRYLMLGVGFYRPEKKFPGGETDFDREGFLLNAGLGLETFARRNVGIDLYIRGYGYAAEDAFSYSGQAGVGVNFYVLD